MSLPGLICQLMPYPPVLSLYIRPLQFNYLSYKLFLGKVIFGVLRTKVVLKFSVRLQKKKSASFKNILCKCEFNQLQEAIIAVVEPQT